MTRAPASPGDAVTLLAWLRRAGSVAECEVRGASMHPAIPDGTDVRIRFDGGAGASPGDAVAIRLGDDVLTVHRLVARGASRRSREHVLTLGDGNLLPEPPLPRDRVLGTVEAIRRPSGAWEPVPHAAPRGTLARIARGIATAAIRVGLDVHPRVGIWVKDACIVLVLPAVWLRPYDAARRPAIARFGGPR
ncbi:MAG: S24/S26 family peptidase [Gemmatimonadetes bacterium]|nr:S24/S26 family peptidase [Gemmatimonadota bacterium]